LEVLFLLLDDDDDDDDGDDDGGGDDGAGDDVGDDDDDINEKENNADDVTGDDDWSCPLSSTMLSVVVLHKFASFNFHATMRWAWLLLSVITIPFYQVKN